jgi:NDP-sugar pyrophosphorylase family protein
VTSALPPALILAAGKGTRLGDLGRALPKVLVPIGGRPLLDRHLEHLEGQGVARVVINAHHLADQIGRHLASYRGTAGAALNALDALGRSRFFVIYGDVILFEPLQPVLRTHDSSGAIATLTVYECDDTTAKGVVEVDPGGRVQRFVEQDPQRTGPGLVNAGLYVVEPELLSHRPSSFERSTRYEGSGSRSTHSRFTARRPTSCWQTPIARRPPGRTPSSRSARSI